MAGTGGTDALQGLIFYKYIESFLIIFQMFNNIQDDNRIHSS